MIKRIITKAKRKPILGDLIGNEDGFHIPYVGSAAYGKLFGLFWIRLRKVNLKGKNH